VTAPKNQPVPDVPAEKPATCGACPRYDYCARHYTICAETVVCAVRQSRNNMSRLRKTRGKKNKPRHVLADVSHWG
jgi:hypothetical protein